MKAVDFKKEYKEFYLPPKKPELIDVPAMNFIAVRGKGDPNQEDGEYKQAIGLLYGIAYTIKMSKKGNHHIEGYYDYVVPPLEGFWWQTEHFTEKLAEQTENLTEDVAERTENLTEDVAEQPKHLTEDTMAQEAWAIGQAIMKGVDYGYKENFQWISLIRLPDFVTRADFEWAVLEATRKKKMDFSKVKFFTYTEGLCVQCMHIGPYDEEPANVWAMDAYAQAMGYEADFSGDRYHHEIYLSDIRKCAPEKLKTVIRHPVRRAKKEPAE